MHDVFTSNTSSSLESMVMKKRRAIAAEEDAGSPLRQRRLLSGPLVFILMVCVVTVGSIECISTVRSYAISLAELHALQREESTLRDQKRALNNNIDRWKDKAYVTAQARDRLGFIFPGEQAVRVEHPEAVTGTVPNEFAQDNNEIKDRPALPWYSDLLYALHKADKPDNMPTL